MCRYQFHSSHAFFLFKMFFLSYLVSASALLIMRRPRRRSNEITPRWRTPVFERKKKREKKKKKKLKGLLLLNRRNERVRSVSAGRRLPAPFSSSPLSFALTFRLSSCSSSALSLSLSLPLQSYRHKRPLLSLLSFISFFDAGGREKKLKLTRFYF